MSALVAVVQRDLRGAERAGLLGSARAVALAGIGLFVLARYAEFGAGSAEDVPVAAALMVGGLMLLSLLFASSFALGAFRQERQSGTLDLLLLSGLGARELALGRTLSCFFVLQSIAVAALPALMLLWFFRTPSPRAWLLHAVALTCWNAAVAAAGVALSAWSRRPGTALAGGLIALPAFAALSLTDGARLAWSAPGLVHQTYTSGGELDASRAFLCIGAHAALAGVGILLAGFGLEQPRPDAALGDATAPRRRRHPSEARPLTWLLHRSSPASRPLAQLLALLGGLALLGLGALAAPSMGGATADILSSSALSPIGGGIALLSIGTALAAGATRIAAERDRRTWDSIAASARSSERLFSDLIESTLLCCLVPFALGASLLVSAELGRGVELTDAVVPALSLFASLFLATVLGLAASACARGSATALALAGVLALGVPALVAGGQLLGAGGGLFGGGAFLLAFALVLGFPIIVRGLAPFLLLAFKSLREESREARRPGRLITRPLLVLIPLALLTGAATGVGDQAWALAYGGAHLALIHVATLGEERSLLDPDLLLSGALWQALFALLNVERSLALAGPLAGTSRVRTRRAATTALLLLAFSAPAATAGVQLRAESTPSARRPTGRIVFGVTLENDASPDRGILVIEQLDIQAERRVELQVELAPNARKTLLVAFDTSPGSHDFELRFVSGSDVLAEARVRSPSVGAASLLVGVLGPVPGWLRRQSEGQVRAVELAPALLPSDVRTWPTLDAILWPDPRVGDLEEATAEALRTWVQQGGRLLAGTALDQPRALEELGFHGWPAVGESFRTVGFGTAARSELDLARRSPAESLALSDSIETPVDRRWSAGSESLFERKATGTLNADHVTPEAPVWGVGLVLGAYLLLAGPGEWLSQRRAAKRGRRPAFAALRRPVLLLVATGAVLLLAGDFAATQIETVRIDLVDIDLASDARRARGYVIVRQRGGGWMRLEVPAGTHLSAGLGSLSGTQGWNHTPYEPPRILQAGLRQDATQRSARTLTAQWATVSWRLAYEPDAARVEVMRARARELTNVPASAITRPARLDRETPVQQLQEILDASREAAGRCWARTGDLETLRHCAESSLDAFHVVARRRGTPRLDMAWPNGAAAWIAVEEAASGPELLINGERAPGRRFTVWRVLLPEEPS